MVKRGFLLFGLLILTSYQLASAEITLEDRASSAQSTPAQSSSSNSPTTPVTKDDSATLQNLAEQQFEYTMELVWIALIDAIFHVHTKANQTVIDQGL